MLPSTEDTLKMAASSHSEPRSGIDVLVAQLGPQPWASQGGGERVAEWLRPQLGESSADLVVLSELATTPFFSVSEDKTWLTAGESLGGEETAPLMELAALSQTYMVVPFAERDEETGGLYNSGSLIGPDGRAIPGRYCTGPRKGEEAMTYRKVHLSENRNTTPGVYEKYFFRPGEGFVVFDTELGRIAILICYDRSFPESWRAVRLAGARIVAMPVASSRPERAKAFAAELDVAAVQQGIFVLAASKGGTEDVDHGKNEVTYFGASRVVGPTGTVLAEGPVGEGPEALRCRLDLSDFEAHDRAFHFLRDRRPDLY